METAQTEIHTVVEAEPVGGDVVLLARQPILDTADRIHGHELLFRRDDGSGWPIEDEDQATARVLVAAFADMALGALTSGSRAWINTRGSFLLGTDLSILPADRVVLEVLERDRFDAALCARVAELAAKGYTIALDDFVWRDDAAPMLEAATYVKLDVRELGIAGVAEQLRLLEPYDVRVVAEKVETADEVGALVRLGVGLFQGYHFERPHLVRGRPPAADIGRLRKTTSLATNATFEDVEQVVKLDPGITLRLLRYINSAAVALRSTVSSLRQALMLVGANTVRQWLLLVLLGDVGSMKPAVLSAALLRARLCETLAPEMRVRNRDSAFIVGLLSVCDALLETPLDEIIPALPLADDVKDAIVSRSGPLGALLTAAVELEQGRVAAPSAQQAAALYASVQWADAQLAEFSRLGDPVAELGALAGLEQDDGLAAHRAEHEDLGADRADLARREVHDGDDLSPEQLVVRVVRDLRARALDADLGAEVDAEPPRRLAGLGELLDLDDPADAHVDLQKVVERDLHGGRPYRRDYSPVTTSTTTSVVTSATSSTISSTGVSGTTTGAGGAVTTGSGCGSGCGAGSDGWGSDGCGSDEAG